MKRTITLLVLCLLFVGMAGADVDVLVVGSSRSFNTSEKAFNAQSVADALRSILQGDASVGAVNVVFDDIYTTKAIDTAIGQSGTIWSRTYYRHSLAQYYFWPEGRTNRLDTLNGAAGTTWDYVVLMDDPYLMAKMPGAHAAGVKLAADAAISGGAKVLLMMQWPGSVTSSTVDHFGEVAYRVGDYDGITVIPSGYAWDSLSPKDSSSSHPTPHGAYLAAAAIYAEMYNQSAGAGSSYNVDDGVADHALAEVQARKLTPQYSDNFNFVNPFAIREIKKRHYTGWDRGTSTEDGIKGAYRGSNFLPFTLTANSWTSPGSTETAPAYPSTVYDFNIGRANSIFESWKRYIVDTNYFSCAFGIPMQDHRNTGPVTMLYGIDKRTDDGTDLGIGHKMINNGEVDDHGRTLPVRLLWAKMFEDNPTWSAYSDSWHMHGRLNAAIASFLYTIYSGRCAVGTTGGSDYLYARRLGYETAWRMSTLQLRAPGFEVLPTSWSATNVTPTNAQTLSVKFITAPTSEVSVVVSTDDPYRGKASPSVLTFTPANYSDPQTVTVLGVTGPAGGYPFNAILTTSSTDLDYDGVSDAWDFFNTRPEGPVPSDIRILGNGITIISGDMDPETATGTDFGITAGSVVRTFTITNQSGSATVTLSGSPQKVSLTAPGGHFVLSQDASTGSLGPNSATTFAVTYLPQSSGTHTALVSVASSDAALPLYTFGIAGVRPGAPTVITQGSVPEDATSVAISGQLSSGGAAEAWLCWGHNDAGTSGTGSWNNVVAIGSVTEDIPFTAMIAGLDTNASYWFRCYVSNGSGEDWSDGAESFSGTAVNTGGGGNLPVTDGLLAQWDAGTITGVANGAQVDSWQNARNPGTYDLTRAGGSPKYAAAVAGLNNKPAVVFSDGGGDWFDFTDITTIRTVFWVLRDNPYSADQKFLLGDDGQYHFHCNGTKIWHSTYTHANIMSGSTEVNGSVVDGLATDRPSDYSIISVVTVGNVEASHVSRDRTYGRSWEGEMAEILIYNTPLSSDDEDAVGAYLAWKYGLSTAYPHYSSSPIANLAPTGITVDQVMLNATLTAENTNYTVYVHWGPSDGGTNTSGWLHTSLVGSWTNVASTNISYPITGLEAGQRYSYTFMATDSVSNSWAAPSWRFFTAGSAGGRTHTISHTVPHAWLASINAGWATNYEAAAMSDPDGDGFTTWEEYWTGTDPNNSNSFCKIDAIAFEGTNVRLNWRHAQVDAGLPALAIQASTNLINGPWVSVGTNVPIAGANSWIQPSSQNVRYYRLAATNTP